MIPTIGLMVGSYIIAKMVALLKKETTITNVFCVIAIIISLLGMFDLMVSGSSPL